MCLCRRKEPGLSVPMEHREPGYLSAPFFKLAVTEQLRLYIIGEESLLYSARSRQIFGLDRVAAVTLLKLSGGEEPHDPADPGVLALKALLSGCEAPAEEYCPQRFCSEIPPAPRRKYRCYRLLNTTFAIVCDDSATSRMLNRLLAHLVLQEEAMPGLLFNVRPESEQFRLFMNGVQQGGAMPPSHLAPLILDRLRKHAYQREPYLLALHAAVVSWNDRVIVLPGLSGSGKSTLATALLARGGELLSDEVALVLTDGTMVPIPLPPGLKCGSWPLLADEFPSLTDTDVHHRWDGLAVRYLSSETVRLASKPERATHLVFPQFSPDTMSGIEPVSAVQALCRLSDTGFQLQGLDEGDAEAIITWLLSLSCCVLRYGSTDEALNLLGISGEAPTGRRIHVQ